MIIDVTPITSIIAAATGTVAAITGVFVASDTWLRRRDEAASAWSLTAEPTGDPRVFKLRLRFEPPDGRVVVLKRIEAHRPRAAWFARIGRVPDGLGNQLEAGPPADGWKPYFRVEREIGRKRIHTTGTTRVIAESTVSAFIRLPEPVLDQRRPRRLSICVRVENKSSRRRLSKRIVTSNDVIEIIKATDVTASRQDIQS